MKNRLKAKKSKKRESESPISRVTIDGEGRDEWGDRYFKLQVKDSKVDLPPYSVSQIIKDKDEMFTALGNAGANFFKPTSQRDLIDLLEKRKVEEPTFEVVTRLGWNSGAFVLPDGIIGKPKLRLEVVFGGLDRQTLAKYRCRGTLEEWQDKIANKARGNSRLMLAASLAFTGPILRFVQGPKGGGFQLFGPRETGKTTAAMLIGSVWGCHRSDGRDQIGFAETWHTTNNQLEATVRAHNDTILLLDETTLAGDTAQKRAVVVLNAITQLSHLREKERMNNVVSSRSWRGYFFSTSNLSLEALAKDGNVTLDDAHRSRLTEVSLPDKGHGIYENLHGFASGEKLSDALIGHCRRYFGTAGREFVKNLVVHAKRDKKGLRRWLKRRRRFYTRALNSAATESGLTPMKRSTGRCATVYAAGALAIEYEILPFECNELLQAIVSCQIEGLKSTQAASATTDLSVGGLRNKLIAYLQEHEQQFLDLDQARPTVDTHKFGSVPGYIATHKKTKWFYLTAEKLVAIIGNGPNAVALKKELITTGLLEKSGPGRSVVQRQIYSGVKKNKGWRWVHAIKADILQPVHS